MTLLGSLPTSYATLVTAFEARVDNIKMDYVQQALVHEEMKHTKLPGQSNRVESALMETKRNKSRYSPNCFRYDETSHIRRFCRKESLEIILNLLMTLSWSRIESTRSKTH